MSSFRFYRRKQIFPGVRLNVSASGPSLSFGVRGAHVTVGPPGVLASPRDYCSARTSAWVPGHHVAITEVADTYTDP